MCERVERRYAQFMPVRRSCAAPVGQELVATRVGGE